MTLQLDGSSVTTRVFPLCTCDALYNNALWITYKLSLSVKSDMALASSYPYSLVFFYFVIWAYALKSEYINLGFEGDKLLVLEA